MQQYSIGANQTVINNVYPKLHPLIADQNKVTGLIDVYSVMGGETSIRRERSPLGGSMID